MQLYSHVQQYDDKLMVPGGLDYPCVLLSNFFLIHSLSLISSLSPSLSFFCFSLHTSLSLSLSFSLSLSLSLFHSFSLFHLQLFFLCFSFHSERCESVSSTQHNLVLSAVNMIVQSVTKEQDRKGVKRGYFYYNLAENCFRWYLTRVYCKSLIVT